MTSEFASNQPTRSDSTGVTEFESFAKDTVGKVAGLQDIEALVDADATIQAESSSASSATNNIDMTSHIVELEVEIRSRAATTPRSGRTRC